MLEVNLCRACIYGVFLFLGYKLHCKVLKILFSEIAFCFLCSSMNEKRGFEPQDLLTGSAPEYERKEGWFEPQDLPTGSAPEVLYTFFLLLLSFLFEDAKQMTFNSLKGAIYIFATHTYIFIVDYTSINVIISI